MQTPVQVPPVPRRFMQQIVSREWGAAAEEMLREGGRREKKGGRKKAIPNPCLIRLTTFAVTRSRRQF